MLNSIDFADCCIHIATVYPFIAFSPIIILVLFIAILCSLSEFCLVFQAHSFARFFRCFCEIELFKISIFFILFIILVYQFFNSSLLLPSARLYNSMIAVRNWGIFIIIFCIMNTFNSHVHGILAFIYMF